MKKLFFLAVIAAFASCSKKESAAPDSQTELQVSAALKPGQDLEYALGDFGDEEGAVFIQQAAHFDISEIKRRQQSGSVVVYHYVPAVGFVGNDEVVIRSQRGSDGASAGSKIWVTRIRMVVTQ